MPRSRQTCRAGSVMRAPAQPEQGAPEPMQEEQQPAMEPAQEEQVPASDDDADNNNWEPPTTDEDQDLMPARGPDFQAALLESFE